MAELKQQIAAREYRVDSALVAEAIIRKMRLVRWARVELSGAAADQIRPGSAAHH